MSLDKISPAKARRPSRPADSPPESAGRGPRGPLTLGFLALLAAVLFTGFTSLGIWQVKRLEWKRALIAQVDARAHGEAVTAPGPAQWSCLDDETYRKVQLTGDFLEGEILVQANTDLGPGFWVLAPMRTDRGFIVLVNRGFVSPDRRDPVKRGLAQASISIAAPAGPTTAVGLLRQSEPGGGFLRENDPDAQRWYSRDVAAMANALGLASSSLPVAPYFVDAGATPVGVWPVGGLTVISFKNSHAVYAMTWFGLALMVAAAAWYVARVERRLRQAAGARVL